MEIWKELEALQGQMKSVRKRKKLKQSQTIFLCQSLLVVVSKYNIFHFNLNFIPALAITLFTSF